jgi:hypothetical protein
VSFAIGLVLYIVGSIAVAVCLLAIPGQPGATPAPPARGHGGH